MNATVSPSGAYYESLTWTSSNTGVATVDANGNDETLSSDIAEAQHEYTDIRHIAIDGKIISVRNGEIIAPDGAEIYNIHGIRMNGGHVTAGIYIVRIAGKSVKVAVK